MRISDWSSDVCSSDLPCRRTVLLPKPRQRTSRTSTGSARTERTWRPYARKGNPPRPRLLWRDQPRRLHARQDWKSAVMGKGGSVRVNLGGRRILKKKQKYTQKRIINKQETI